MVLLREPVRTILLDIEGTTTPISFVHDTLFPYARMHVRGFLEQHHASTNVRADLAGLREENWADVRAALNPPALDYDSPRSELESTVAYLEWLMARDRKSTALKSLQGKIWEQGYQSGTLRAPVFDDVPGAFDRWCRQNRSVAIFSSGSVLAQQLLFSHTTAGDLTPYISAYFDTMMGAKIDARSYEEIAVSVERSAHEMAFISDVTAELDAASRAGLQVLLCERIGNHPQPPSPHTRIGDFSIILP
jgi:enolase-phosphatase E1